MMGSPYAGGNPYMQGFNPLMNPFLGVARPMGGFDPMAAWYMAHYGQQVGAVPPQMMFAAAPFGGFYPQVGCLNPDLSHAQLCWVVGLTQDHPTFS